MPPPNSTPSKCPSTIGRYHCHELLGRGGMGEVYLGYDPSLDRQVAIKCLRKDKNSESFLARLEKEARALARVSHPNIVAIYDVVREEGLMAIVMEYIPGKALSTIIRNDDYSHAQGLDWLIQIARGLLHAHRAGLIHRDLKADNILIAHDNRLKIVDFGIAKHVFDSHTTEHQFMGSYIALSPEQLAGETVDTRSDLFAFGILSCLVMSRTHPFGSPRNSAQMLANIAKGTPLIDFNADIYHGELGALVSKLLAPEKSDRPESIGAALEKLDQLKRGGRWESERVALSPITETIVVDNDVESSNAVLRPYLNNTLKEPDTALQTRKTGSRYLLVGTFALLVCTALTTYLFISATPQKSYVAIVPPNVLWGDDTSNSSERDMVVDTLRGMEEFITGSRSLSLIPLDEHQARSNNLDEIAKVMGIDELLEIDANCHSMRCDLVLRRRQASDGEVTSVQRWIGHINDSHISHVNAFNNMKALFPNADVPNSYIDTIDIELFRLFEAIRIAYVDSGHAPRSVLQQLTPLFDKMADYPPLYTLFIEVALNAYHLSEDSEFLDLARTTVERAEKRFGSPDWNLQNHYEIALAEERYEDAIKISREWGDLTGDLSDQFIWEATAYYYKGDNKKAEAIYRQALSHRSTRTGYWGLSQSVWHQGRLDEALAITEEYLRIFPNDYYARMTQARIFSSQGQLDKAIPLFEALANDYPDAVSLGNLADAYFLAGDIEKSIATYEECLAIEPNYTSAELGLADAYKSQGNFEAAQQMFEAMLGNLGEYESDVYDRKTKLARAQAELGAASEAVKTLQELENEHPDIPRVMLTSALVYATVGETISALVYIEKAKELGLGDVWFRHPNFASLCGQRRFHELTDQAQMLCANN